MDNVYDQRYLGLQFYISFTTCMEEARTHSPAVHQLHLAANVVCYLNSTTPMQNAILHLFTQLQKKPSIHLKPLKPKPQPRNQLYTPGRFQIPLLLNNVASDIKSTSPIHTHNTNPQTPNTFTKLQRIQAQPTHAHNTITAQRNQKKSQTNHIKPRRKRQSGRKLRLTLRIGETHRVSKTHRVSRWRSEAMKRDPQP